jgi:NCAIR mutase (PurE)-related protein
MTERTHLVEVDGGLPEVVGLLVEVPHTDLTEVTGMVFVHVGPVVVLTTSQTTTTGVCVSRIPSAFSPKLHVVHKLRPLRDRQLPQSPNPPIPP